MASDIHDVIVAGIGPGSEITTFLTFGLGTGAEVGATDWVDLTVPAWSADISVRPD